MPFKLCKSYNGLNFMKLESQIVNEIISFLAIIFTFSKTSLDFCYIAIHPIYIAVISVVLEFPKMS